MDQGFIPGERSKVVTVLLWVSGPPEPSFWKGTKLTGKQQRPITAYRCPRCGRLDLYAADRSFTAAPANKPRAL